MNRSNLTNVLAAVIIAAAIVAAPHLAPTSRLERISPQSVVQQAASQKTFATSEGDYVFVAQTHGVDDAVDDHILALLLRNGIQARIRGEFIYGVCVPNQDKDKAIALLAVDAAKKGYWINFDIDSDDGS